MRRLAMIATTVCAALLVPRVTLCLVHAKGLPKQPGRVLGPSEVGDKPGLPSEYKALSAKYLANVDRLADERREMERNSYRHTLDGARRAGSQVDARESQILADFRAKIRRGGRKTLGFEDDVAVVLVPTSDASARIAAALLADDAIDPSDLACLAVGYPSLLSPGWLSLLQDIAAKADLASQTWECAARALCAAGVSREKYRAGLQRLAVGKADDVALTALFFDIDRQTGEDRPVRGPENLALMRKLADPKSDPEVRLVCARYSAAIGDKALAEAICTQLLSAQYKSLNDPEGETPDEDLALGRAKSLAMILMFYRLRNERAFRAIYDLSRLPEIEQEMVESGQAPSDWIPTYRDPGVKLDVDQAQGLVDQVRQCPEG